jgi:uncharacterized UPF0160 family protein
VLANILREVWNTTYTQSQLDKFYSRLYYSFIQEIDAIDNGVSVADEPRYRISTDLASRVGRFNKEWNSTADKNQEEQFKKAMAVTEEELMWQIRSFT